MPETAPGQARACEPQRGLLNNPHPSEEQTVPQGTPERRAGSMPSAPIAWASQASCPRQDLLLPGPLSGSTLPWRDTDLGSNLSSAEGGFGDSSKSLASVSLGGQAPLAGLAGLRRCVGGLSSLARRRDPVRRGSRPQHTCWYLDLTFAPWGTELPRGPSGTALLLCPLLRTPHSLLSLNPTVPSPGSQFLSLPRVCLLPRTAVDGCHFLSRRGLTVGGRQCGHTPRTEC